VKVCHGAVIVFMMDRAKVKVGLEYPESGFDLADGVVKLPYQYFLIGFQGCTKKVNTTSGIDVNILFDSPFDGRYYPHFFLCNLAVFLFAFWGSHLICFYLDIKVAVYGGIFLF
jgi:hypothetical protein